MEAYELVQKALEPSEGAPPDNAMVRVSTTDGYIFDIVDTEYEEDGNVLWLRVEVAE